MAEDTQAAAQDPHGAGQTQATVSREDYERLLAQSRKWEDRAKANAEEARAFDEMRVRPISASKGDICKSGSASTVQPPR